MLQAIRPDFSGSAQSMNAAMYSINQVGDISKDFLAQLRQDKLDKEALAERDYQHNREKIADARVATKWEQEQDAYKRAELQDGLLGKYVQGITPAIGQPQVITNPDGTAQPVVGQPQAQAPMEGSLASQSMIKYHPGTNERVITQQGQSVLTNPNPTIKFNPLVTGNQTAQGPLINTTKMVRAEDRHGNEYYKPADGSPYIKPTDNTNGAKLIATIKNAMPWNSNPAIEEFYDKKDTLISSIKSKYEKEEAKLLKTLPQLNTLQRTSSVLPESTINAMSAIRKDMEIKRNTEIQSSVAKLAAGTLRAPTPISTKAELASTKLSDINLSKAYDSNGNVLGDKLLVNQKNASEVYFKTGDGKLISSKAYDKGLQAQQASYQAGAVTTKVVPGTAAYYEQVSGTSNKTIPTSDGGRMQTSAFVGKVDTAVDSAKQSDIFNPATPTRAEQVVETSNGIIDKMLKENPTLRYSEVSKAVLEAVKQRIPDGSMTDTERAKLDQEKELRTNAFQWKLQDSKNQVDIGNNIRSTNASLLANARSNAVTREGHLLAHKDAKTANDPIAVAQAKYLIEKGLPIDTPPAKIQAFMKADFALKNKTTQLTVDNMIAKNKRDSETYNKQHDWIPFND